MIGAVEGATSVKLNGIAWTLSSSMASTLVESHQRICQNGCIGSKRVAAYHIRIPTGAHSDDATRGAQVPPYCQLPYPQDPLAMDGLDRKYRVMVGGAGKVYATTPRIYGTTRDLLRAWIAGYNVQD